MEEKQSATEAIISDTLPFGLEENIKIIAKKQNYINYEIVSKKISTDGSYMGVLYEIDIKGKTTEGDKEINIFSKNIVENIDMPIYSVPGVFETEAWAYKELFNIFTKLQDEANIPHNQRFQTPYSFEECNSKSIILEHLGKKGFKLYDRMEIMPLDYAKKCVEELAKFHSLTFVIKEKDLDFINAKVVTKNQPYNFGEEWYAFVNNMANYSINVLEPDVREKVKDKLLQKAADYPKYMTDTSTVRTLCHGDYKLNNIMAREINGKLIDVKPIDYQILHYGCPLLDFIYFLFHGTDQEFRKHHLACLKDLYYQTMEAFLHKFGIGIKNVFPRDDFEEIYKQKLDFGLMVNIFYAPFLFAAADDAPDVTTQELSTLDFKVDRRFVERFCGVVDDFIKWGYI